MPPMPNHPLARATRWITAAAQQHGDALAAHVMEREGISRRRARKLLAALVRARWLDCDGSPRRPRYRPGPLRQVVHAYALPGLQEDLPWARDFAPLLALAPQVARLAQHAFTELLNNAADHSAGSTVTVSMRQTATHLQLLVSDDGCGLFQRIEQGFDIGDPALAMLELSKGKLSTLPERHCGHGLYFVARLADVLELHANRHAFQHRGWGRPGWHAGRPMPHAGTSVFLAIALDTERRLDDVLRAGSLGHGSYVFDSTQVPLQLLTGPQIGLESRAQARRVTARLAGFRRATLDFSGIDDIGPAFADELMRVYARAHPQVELLPVGASPRVAEMLQAVG